MGNRRRISAIEAVVSALRKADDAVASVAQRYVDARAARGVSLPGILRDAVFHSMASIIFVGAVALWDENFGAAILLFMLSVTVAPGEIRLWKRHAARAAEDWTASLAQKCLSEAASRKWFFFPFRIALLILNGWSIYAVTAYPFTVTDVACLPMVAVFTARLYFERSLPTPPSAPETTPARLVTQT